MQCFKRSVSVSDDSFLIDGIPFTLQECNSDEEKAVQLVLEENWYIECHVSSKESSGGWSGSTSNNYIFHNMTADNVVLDEGKPIGFRVDGRDSDPGVSKLFFAIEKENVYFPTHKVKHYSFDGGDGDGISTYKYSLRRKDKQILDIINNYHILEEYNGKERYIDINYFDVFASENSYTIKIFFEYFHFPKDIDERRSVYSNYLTLKKK